MGRHRKIIETELSDFETSFSEDKKRSSIAKLTGKNIIQFNGETYNGSLSLAFQWLKETNEDPDLNYTVTMEDYYPQEHKAKAILVSYNTKPKEQ
jgi:hypothetical protein